MSQATRAELVTLLHDCGVFTLRELGVEEAYLAGTCDVEIVDLQMDSLSAMEFCIALEERWGLSVVPADVARLGSLDGLRQRLLGPDAR